MILWTIKQLLSLRKIFSGRAHPSELAWGLALGLAIGLVPKGNLVSLLLIGLLVSVRVNHGMAALAAVSFSFIAGHFDSWTHQLGASILQAPSTRPTLERYWNMPLVPWTDLNNTVVMGSTVIALVGLLPTALVSLPIFRWLAPHKPENESNLDPPPSVAAIAGVNDLPTARSVEIIPIHSSVRVVTAAEINTTSAFTPEMGAPSGCPIGLKPESQVESSAETHVETQIDIIRMKSISDDEDDEPQLASDQQGPMNEALGYLLRRLKDSRQGKAA